MAAVMRRYVYNAEKNTIDYEVLQYNSGTGLMKVKCQNGTIYERYFALDAPHNSHYHLLWENDDAKLAELRAQYQAGRKDSESKGGRREERAAPQGKKARRQEGAGAAG